MLRDYAVSFARPSNALHVDGDYRRFGTTSLDYEPMTLEGGFGYAAAVMEMLLQSWGGKIRVFPAVPDFWPDAWFRSLRAEGAFLVTARRREGKTVFVEIVSESGGTCRVENCFEDGAEIRCEDVATRKGALLSGPVLSFDTRPGHSYRIHPAEPGLTDRDLQLPVP